VTEPRARDVLVDPIFRRNPVMLLVLGICSALVVTKKLETAVVMAASVVAVLAASNTIVSAIRRVVGRSVRIFVQITIIASLVIVVDQVLRAFLPDVARQLSVFVSLIVTNCIVMARAEGFAMSHRPWLSFLDGVGNALGYGVVLIAVAFVRELFGYGTVFGATVLPAVAEGGWYVPNGMMRLPPMALVLVGLGIWALRTWRPEQREERP